MGIPTLSKLRQGDILSVCWVQFAEKCRGQKRDASTQIVRVRIGSDLSKKQVAVPVVWRPRCFWPPLPIDRIKNVSEIL
jgi:hypothetical protein